MLTRVLAVLGVGVWCLFLLLVSVVFVIDRGLADVGIVWIAVFGIGVVGPVLILRQMTQAIAAHEESRRATPGVREKEKELLGALEERGDLTPATAAMRTSLTVDEASRMLEELALKGHLEMPLSERELEVLTLLATGKTNSEVAGDLFVSVGTVKSHTGNIYRKLGAKNRAEALARARELRLIR